MSVLFALLCFYVFLCFQLKGFCVLTWQGFSVGLGFGYDPFFYSAHTLLVGFHSHFAFGLSWPDIQTWSIEGYRLTGLSEKEEEEAWPVNSNKLLRCKFN